MFYYGYYCNHCVSQLFALSDDISMFRELGAEVLAISPDTSAETSQKFARYGHFTFPVLSDSDNRVAATYSVFAPRTPTTPQTLLHGTFVIDQGGIVRWCHYSREPFTNNAALLSELAKAQGHRPTALEPAAAQPDSDSVGPFLSRQLCRPARRFLAAD